MTRDEFKTRLDAYGRAWENRDANAAADWFSDNATYLHPSPSIEKEKQ